MWQQRGRGSCGQQGAPAPARSRCGRSGAEGKAQPRSSPGPVPALPRPSPGRAPLPPGPCPAPGPALLRPSPGPARAAPASRRRRGVPATRCELPRHGLTRSLNAPGTANGESLWMGEAVPRGLPRQAVGILSCSLSQPRRDAALGSLV